MFLVTPLSQQLAHDLGALYALCLAVAVENCGFGGGHFKADFCGFLSHGSVLTRNATTRPASETAATGDGCIFWLGFGGFRPAGETVLVGFTGGGKHSSHRLLFGLDAIKQRQQRRAKLIVWLPVVALANRQFADSRLTAPNCLGDLWLRHLAVTLDVGYYVFPVHTISITKNRYLQTMKRFLFFVSCCNGN